MGVSEMATGSEPEFCGVPVSASRAELSKAVGSIWLGTHKGAKGNRFRGNAGKDIKRMSGDNVREVRDYGNAVPDIGGFVGRGVNGWSGMRKSRGRVRT